MARHVVEIACSNVEIRGTLIFQLDNFFWKLTTRNDIKKKKKIRNFCNISNVYFIIELINEFRN